MNFRDLHDRTFVMPNVWDPGSARILTQLGFEALATTSAGYAFSVGQADNTIGRDRMLEHAADIVAATKLPVSADLENGFANDPEGVAETVRLAARTGLAGLSIEDANGGKGLYEYEHAVERIRAAAEAAGSLTLTARAENFLVGRPDLKDTIRRLQGYQEAGAHVLFAPGIATREQIEEVVRSVDRPVNVIMGLQGVRLTVSELSAIGVRRISVGSALTRAAFTAMIEAAKEMLERGTFTWAEKAIPFRDFTAMMK